MRSYNAMEIARLKGLTAVNVCLTAFLMWKLPFVKLRWKVEDDAQFIFGQF